MPYKNCPASSNGLFVSDLVKQNDGRHGLFQQSGFVSEHHSITCLIRDLCCHLEVQADSRVHREGHRRVLGAQLRRRRPLRQLRLGSSGIWNPLRRQIHLGLGLPSSALQGKIKIIHEIKLQQHFYLLV